MSFSTLRVAGQCGGHLTRFDLPKRLISIFFFYLILAVCGASLVLYWYFSSAPVLHPPVFIPQFFLNFELAWWGCILLEAVLLVRGYERTSSFGTPRFTLTYCSSCCSPSCDFSFFM